MIRRLLEVFEVKKKDTFQDSQDALDAFQEAMRSVTNGGPL